MKKLISLIFCLLPLILFILFAVNYLPDYIYGTIYDSDILPYMINILAMVISTFAVMVWLMIKTFKNPVLSGGAKAAWMILLYSVNIFIYPIYWLIFLRKN